jgi:Flp pilus assembly protein TadG
MVWVSTERFAVSGQAPSQRREHERGQALVELTLVVAILMTMTLSVFDLGRGLQAYLAIIQGARDGARVAMDAGSTDATIRTAALNAAAPFTAVVSIARTGSTVSVTLNYQYQPITPFLGLIGGGGMLPISARMTSQ